MDRRFFVALVPGAKPPTTDKTMSNNTATLSIRTSQNPFHHLWNNNGTWWCHYTEHLPDFTKRRVRRNLHTSDSGIARVLRDSLLYGAAHYEA